MSQPASLWIRSNRLWWYPRHKHSNGIMYTFYQNMILCCCLSHNTQHKYLYSLSTRAQLASPLWKELCGCMWLAHYLQTEVCIWKIQPLGCWLEWKPIYGSMLFFPPQQCSSDLLWPTLSRSLFSCSVFSLLFFTFWPWHTIVDSFCCSSFILYDSSSLSLSYIFNSTKLFSSALRDPSLCISIQTAAAKCCSISH